LSNLEEYFLDPLNPVSYPCAYLSLLVTTALSILHRKVVSDELVPQAVVREL